MSDEAKEPRPAGPVAAGDPPPPAEQEGVPPTAPPAGEAVEQERDEYLDLARRTKADFENFRKRVAADLEAAQARGKVEMARGVIDAVDNLERALESSESSDVLATGVEMVLKGLCETLAKHGIETVDPKGEKFDPNQHEALSTMAVEGTESGTVVEVMQKGYALGDQLIRPARVVVSS